jgi:Protein of unknown function (DUF998)
MSPSESVRRAAGAAVALMAVFPAAVVVLNLVQLGHYDPAANAISLLALGRGGAALNVAFILGGAAALTAAWVLRRSVARAVAGPLLICFFGCTSVVSGLVDTTPDNAPATTASDVHQLAGVLGFLAVIAAMFVFARRFAGTRPGGITPGRRWPGRSWPRRPSPASRSRQLPCSEWPSERTSPPR